GSNDGTLLKSYRTERLRLVGIDPTASKFSEFYPAGAHVVPDFFSARAFQGVSDSPARVITSVAMFYDLDDPTAFAREVRGCVATALRSWAMGHPPKGTCSCSSVVSTPTTSRRSPR